VIGDINPVAVGACKARLEALQAPVRDLEGPADTTVDAVLQFVNPNGLHLAYLDPFSLEDLPFSVIERLAKFRNIDIVVHFSVMDLQRELELDFVRDESRLEVFAPGWRIHVDPRTMSKRDARAEFVRHWLSLVNSLGFSCSRERPLMTNSNNGPLYRMMFLMRHPLAEKLWGDIAKPPQGNLFA
jgi:three-Cys-motif partner protein